MKRRIAAFAAIICMLFQLLPVTAEGGLTMKDLNTTDAFSMSLKRVARLSPPYTMEYKHYHVQQGFATDGEYAYELDEPNVCVLDYARMKFREDTEFGALDEVLRIDNQLRDRIGIERRGGEMLQPWFAKQMYKVP